MGVPPTAAPAAAAIDVQREEEISRAWRGARPLRDSPLQFDDAPGAKDGERHLISGPSPPYLSDLFEARLVLELNAHGGEDDVAAEREVLAVQPRHRPAREEPGGLGGRPLGHLLDEESERLREVEVLGQISAYLEPGDAAPEGARVEHELADLNGNTPSRVKPPEWAKRWN